MIDNNNSFIVRITSELENFLTQSVEISEGVKFSQYKTIKRIMKFKNNDTTGGSKLKEDLSYDYWFDIISPRVDSQVKNLRFDTKNLMVFSRNPIKDFPAVFISNAQLKEWMAENGEDEKLKEAVEEFVENGNVVFKKIKGGYEMCDPLNTYPFNQIARNYSETDLLERHNMTASELKKKEGIWENIDEVIKDLGNKFYKASELSTDIDKTSKNYEIWEYTGEISEKEFNSLKGEDDGDEHKYFLAKVIVAGLDEGRKNTKHVLFADKLTGDMADHYISAHMGSYKGRLWRVGLYEKLFDHQVRANEIGNDIADGLHWAAQVIFRASDSNIMQNIRTDIENGAIIRSQDLQQVNVRLENLDQLIADWNRTVQDADVLANTTEVVRGESPPSGTPFRTVSVLDSNAGKYFVTARQKITLPYKRVFREWVLPELVKTLKGEDIFRITGDEDMLDNFRKVAVNSWYLKNLAFIGPHTKEIAEAIKEEKLEEMKEVDPAIKNAKEIWEGVLPRLFITITGESYEISEQLQDIIQLMGMEQDPLRIEYMLDTIYRSRGINVPPKRPEQPVEPQLPGQPGEEQQQGQPRQQGARAQTEAVPE